MRYVGCSNHSAWRLMQALRTSDRRNLGAFIRTQPNCMLSRPTRANFEHGRLPVCVEDGTGVVPWSPLGGGLLTGRYERGAPLPQRVRAEGAARLPGSVRWRASRS